MTANLIHVVEPTLQDNRGHCRALVGGLCASAPERSFTVWVGRGAPPDVLVGDNVEVRPWFRRRLRVPQTFLLLRRLRGHPGIVFLPTAGRTDLVVADRAMGRGDAPAKLALYFHWLRSTPSRLRSLRGVASRRPGLALLTTTEAVRDVLLSCGFRNVRHVPYPAPVSSHAPAEPAPFRHVLYAGAARRDKGFQHLVALVEHLARTEGTLPAAVQTGGDFYGRMEDAVRGDLQRLRAAAYAHLTSVEGDLDPARYRDLFRGAVCLQLYDPASFSDRVSGVTIDAFLAGAPVVAREGTWISRQVQRFNAGVVLERTDPDHVLAGVQSVVARYADLARGAARAGQALSTEHSPRRLFEALPR